MSTIQPANPVKVFFQEVKEGDIRKFNEESNDSDSGGGARDLRLRPESKFWTEMQDFFPTIVNSRHRQGSILSQSPDGNSASTATISIMGATAARPGECRICKIGSIETWAISPQDYQAAVGAGSRWFYLLILDDKGHVWASKFRSDVLPQMDASVRAKIEGEISRAKGKTTRGVFSLIQKAKK
jgi:hypothetical protein